MIIHFVCIASFEYIKDRSIMLLIDNSFVNKKILLSNFLSSGIFSFLFFTFFQFLTIYLFKIIQFHFMCAFYVIRIVFSFYNWDVLLFTMIYHELNVILSGSCKKKLLS